MKSILSCVLLFVAITTNLFPDEKAVYLELLNRNDFLALESHLQDWIDSDPSNPEVYIGFFNYFLRLDSQSGIAIQKDYLTNQYVLGSKTSFNELNVLSALEYIDRGLKIAPDRLDMYFGKIHVLQQISDYSNQSLALCEVLERSGINDNKWFWADNTPIPEGKAFFLNNIQDYFITWYNVGSNASLAALLQSSSKEIDIYPNEVYGYNNAALYYLRNKKYEPAIEKLIQAEIIDPNDYIVLSNIAHCYLEIHHNDKAKEYFQRLLEFPNDVDLEYVKEILSSL